MLYALREGKKKGKRGKERVRSTLAERKKREDSHILQEDRKRLYATKGKKRT